MTDTTLKQVDELKAGDRLRLTDGTTTSVVAIRPAPFIETPGGKVWEVELADFTTTIRGDSRVEVAT